MRIVRGKDLDFLSASHEDPNDPGVLKKILIKDSDLKAGCIKMINWAEMPKGKSFKLHYHESMQEIFIIISGIAKITVEDKEEILEKGDAIIIDANEKHTMSNISDFDIEYLAIGLLVGIDGKTVVV